MPDVPAGRQLQTILDDAVGLWLDLILKPASIDAVRLARWWCAGGASMPRGGYLDGVARQA